MLLAKIILIIGLCSSDREYCPNILLHTKEDLSALRLFKKCNLLKDSISLMNHSYKCIDKRFPILCGDLTFIRNSEIKKLVNTISQTGQVIWGFLPSYLKCLFPSE